jgi:hypothetical protein
MASAYSGVGNDPDSEYFDNSRVFMLSGHGSHNPTDASYTLKENEFYASPTRCDYVTLGTESQWFIFAKSNPTIVIPTPESKSYYSLNYNNFPFRKMKSIKKTMVNIKTRRPLPGEEFEVETNAFKMYVPFSSKEKTRTIPNNIFTFFSFHPNHNLPIRNSTFTFNGNVYDKSKFGNYIAGTLMISGILSPNTNTEVFEDEFERIQVESNALLNAIGNYYPSMISSEGISHRISINNSGKLRNQAYPHKFVLFIILPEYALNANVFNDYSILDPLLEYCKRAMNLMASLSVISIDEFASSKSTFGGRLFAQQPIINVFRLIRNNLLTRFPTNINKPILLLNPLCRDTPDIIGPLVRGNIRNATNIRSLSKNRSTKRYKNFRNKTRKFAAKNRNLKKIIPKLYGPISKKVVNVPTVANLTGIPESNIQTFLNDYGNDNIILNNSNGRAGAGGGIKGFFDTLFKYVPVAY